MGLWALNWAFGQQIGSATGKAILLVIAKYANDSGTCYPGTRTIAKLADCDEKTVRIWLKKLAGARLLLRAERHRPDGKRTTDLLALPLPFRPPTTGHQLPDPPGNEGDGLGVNARAESIRRNKESRTGRSLGKVVDLSQHSMPRTIGGGHHDGMRLAIGRRMSRLADNDDNQRDDSSA